VLRTSIWQRPSPLDALVAAVTFLLSVAAAPPQALQPVPSVSSLDVACVALACVGLLWRRSAPLPVLAITLVCACVPFLGGSGRPSGLFAVLVAVFTVATRHERRVAVMAAAAAAGVLVTVGSVADTGSGSNPVGWALLGLTGMALGVGDAVRSNRAAVADALARAAEVERGRDAEVRREVAEERLRISRELHDVVAHHIAVVNVQAGVAETVLSTDPAGAVAALQQVRHASRQALQEMTAMVGLLRATDEDGVLQPMPGLDEVDALVSHARAGGSPVALSVHGTRPALAPVTELNAYRILQEALTNAVRHGNGAATAQIRYDPNHVTIEVRNRLRGPTTGGSTTGGHGLRGMRERAAACGGRLDAGPRGEEYVVVARLPATEGALG
jgi:signal transduction histidine kinase